jgi:D-glycero-D-manno-heptose 1,7-bisphosphate phosphatase
MSQKALFLDRDGVINIEKNYLYKIEDFEFMDGIFELCHYFQKLDYKIFVVTNQSGIARNYYSESDFQTLTTWMISAFKEQGIVVDKVYHCPHHPDISGVCSCRKPKPGMLLEAIKSFDIDAENSVLVGDKERDIDAAIAAGLNKTYLFSEELTSSKATKIVNHLKEIIEVI